MPGYAVLLKVFFTVLLLASSFSCSREERKLELFSGEAFAFNLEDEWEVNLSVRVKGFRQIESNGSFSHELLMTADLMDSTAVILRNVFSLNEKSSLTEETDDISLEGQFSLDSSYGSGEYVLLVKVNDMISGDSASYKIEFSLNE